MDKTKKRVREHAAKHGMSYQAAWNQLEGGRAPSGALEFWDWIDYVDGPGRSRCLTIADVTAMRPGQRAQLLMMDRNLCDHVHPSPGHALHPPRPPQEFFQLNRDGAMYTHGDGLTGKMLWGWDTQAERADEDFMFEVEYAPGRWHPLVDGCLPTREHLREHDRVPDPRLEETYPGMAFGRPWQELRPETRVGWRGPAMLWKRLPEMPEVFARIDLERLMIAGIMPNVRSVLGTDQDRPMWLRHTSDGWQLVVQDLTDAERERMEPLFADVVIVPGDRSSRPGTKHADDVEARSVLPMQMDDGSELLVSSVSGGADYQDGWPRRLSLSDGDGHREYVQKGPDETDPVGQRTSAQPFQAQVDAVLREEHPGITEGERTALLTGALRRLAGQMGLSREALEGVLGRLIWPKDVAPLTVDDVLGV